MRSRAAGGMRWSTTMTSRAEGVTHGGGFFCEHFARTDFDKCERARILSGGGRAKRNRLQFGTMLFVGDKFVFHLTSLFRNLAGTCETAVIFESRRLPGTTST